MANSKRSCRYCKTRRPIAEMLIVNGGAYCEPTDCATKYAVRNRDKGRAKLKASNRAKLKAFSDNDYPKQFRLTKKACQKLANLLDKDLNCICCGRPRTSQFCGGHYLTSGAHPHLALDLRNIHGQQNHYCNLQRSGNIHGDGKTHGYRKGLINRYGQAFVDWLEGPHEAKKYTCDELIAYRKEVSAEIRRIEKGEPPLRNWRSL